MDADSALEQELAGLTTEQRAWARDQIALRARAAHLAAQLDLDATDVFRMLRHLAYTGGTAVYRAPARTPRSRRS